ncbi:MAG: TIGR02594 family protein [Hyphomicrobiaceae bacterium]
MLDAALRQPAWLDHAWAELGQREIAGQASNTRIADYIRRVGHPEVADDATPWCAAFVGACLERAGLAGTGSLLARSYLSWGLETDEPSFGAVAVLSRGADPALGHVGFLIGTTDDRLVLLGGNQSDAVTVEAFARSRLLGFRVPALTSTKAPASPQPLSSGFAWSLARILEFEGGYSDDPFDPGGPTNKGVTLVDYAAFKKVALNAASYERLKAELRRIPNGDVERIYLDRYWRPARCPDLPPALAHFHFDCAVNQGVGGAARMLQTALGVTVDGAIGPLTLTAARTRPMSRTLERYAEIRRERYRRLRHFWRFGRGWLARVDKALAQANGLASPIPTATPPSLEDRQPDVFVPEAKETETMPDTSYPPLSAPATDAKWWGNSLTIWGTFITGLSTVAPTILSVFGFDIPSSLIEQLGADVVTVAQAVGGLIGTVMTIVGRTRAATPLARRPMSIRL